MNIKPPLFHISTSPNNPHQAPPLEPKPPYLVNYKFLSLPSHFVYINQQSPQYSSSKLGGSPMGEGGVRQDIKLTEGQPANKSTPPTQPLQILNVGTRRAASTQQSYKKYNNTKQNAPQSTFRLRGIIIFLISYTVRKKVSKPQPYNLLHSQNTYIFQHPHNF